MQVDRLTVRVGSSFSNTDGEIFYVEKVIRHPRYSAITLNFDFAILKLTSDIKLEPNVKEIIALPSENDKVDEKTEVFVSGFGLTGDNAYNANALRGVIVPVVSQKICRRIYPLVLSNQMVCAGLTEGGKDSCSGDSGGPMRRGDGILIGIVSFGKGCAKPNSYGVYSKVSAVRKWIKNQTNI